MADISAWWQSGGAAMWFIAVLDLLGFFFVALGFVVALVSRVTGKGGGLARVLAVVGFLGCALPLCAGFTGFSVSRYQVKTAMEGLDPATAESIRQAGEAVAGVPLWFGGMSTLCFGLPALLAVLLAPRRKQAWERAMEETAIPEDG
jgi:hypothetical protein